MENLQSYVDVSDYCAKLSQISNVALDDVKALVFFVFDCINAGIIDSYPGFLIIEEQLLGKMTEDIITLKLAS